MAFLNVLDVRIGLHKSSDEEVEGEEADRWLTAVPRRNWKFPDVCPLVHDLDLAALPNLYQSWAFLSWLIGELRNNDD